MHIEESFTGKRTYWWKDDQFSHSILAVGVPVPQTGFFGVIHNGYNGQPSSEVILNLSWLSRHWLCLQKHGHFGWYPPGVMKNYTGISSWSIAMKVLSLWLICCRKYGSRLHAGSWKSFLIHSFQLKCWCVGISYHVPQPSLMGYRINTFAAIHLTSVQVAKNLNQHQFGFIWLCIVPAPSTSDDMSDVSTQDIPDHPWHSSGKGILQSHQSKLSWPPGIIVNARTGILIQDRSMDHHCSLDAKFRCQLRIQQTSGNILCDLIRDSSILFDKIPTICRRSASILGGARCNIQVWYPGNWISRCSAVPGTSSCGTIISSRASCKACGSRYKSFHFLGWIFTCRTDLIVAAEPSSFSLTSHPV